MTTTDQAPNHIGSHASQSNHSELPCRFFFHHHTSPVLFFNLALLEDLSRPVALWIPLSCHKRTPPRKAFALSPARLFGGNCFNLWTLPPPSTTSSGSKAVIRRSTTSVTYRRHFRLPYLMSPRTPT